MIWLNPKPLLRAYRAFAMSWKRHHPDWALILWQDHPHLYPNIFDETRSTDAFPLRAQSLYEAADSYATKSNILRLEIIAKCGGVYLDTDFICHRPIDALISGLDFFVVEQDEQFINNAIFGATPNHAQINRAIEQLPGISAASEHCPAISTGPHLFTRLFRGDPRVVTIDRTAFYPMSWSGKYDRVDRTSYATHLWAYTWKETIEYEKQC